MFAPAARRKKAAPALEERPAGRNVRLNQCVKPPRRPIAAPIRRSIGTKRRAVRFSGSYEPPPDSSPGLAALRAGRGADISAPDSDQRERFFLCARKREPPVRLRTAALRCWGLLRRRVPKRDSVGERFVDQKRLAYASSAVDRDEFRLVSSV